VIAKSSSSYLPFTVKNFMRVLAVTNMYPTARDPGCGTFVEQQVEGLRQRGVEVQVLYLDRREKGMGVYFRMGPALKNAVSEFRPDLVASMYGGVMAHQVLKHSGLPMVVSFCGTDLLGERCSGFFRRAVTRASVQCSHRVAARADGVVVKSANLLNALPHGKARCTVAVIPNGVDFERFRPMDRLKCLNQLGWDPAVFHVVFAAGTGDPVKRPELARSAVNRLVASGVPAELHFMKGVAHDKVPVWLNAANALLLTSLQEGSPNIVKEALACNRPVVSVNVGDVAERISKVAGCHLAEATSEDLATKLELVRYRTAQVNGRNATQHLSLPAISKQLSEFYSMIVERRGRR
jgi:glycosyltransferase involved in cell wall biosynthesis